LPSKIAAFVERARSSDTFASLHIREYRILWWGGMASFTAVQMQFLLRGLLAWDLTEREGALGLVYLFFGLGLLVFTPFGGVASDRMRKRGLLLWGQALLTSTAVAMGIIVLLDIAQLWMLFVASVFQGAMFGLTGPARVAMAGDLVGRERLGNAIGLSTLSMNGSRVFAPSLAGALAGIALFGIGGAYIVASVFSVVSFVMLFRLPDLEPSGQGGKSPFRDIADGVRYVAKRPGLRRVVLASAVGIMFGFNYIAFLPALIEGEFGRGEGWVGLMSTASSLGAVAASFPIAARADSPAARRILTISGLCFGGTVALLGLAPSLWVAMIVAVAIGASSTGFQVLSNSIALTTSDPSHQGRVQSLMQLSFAGFGIAAFPLGKLAERIGLQPTIVLMGVLTFVAVAVYAIRDQVWQTRPNVENSRVSEAA